MYKVQTVTLTHLMKQKQNLKDETDLKNNFQNISQQCILWFKGNYNLVTEQLRFQYLMQLFTSTYWFSIWDTYVLHQGLKVKAKLGVLFSWKT